MNYRRLSLALGALLFAIAGWILMREFETLGPARVALAMRQQGSASIWLALALVALNYLVLTCHDQLAVAYVGRPLERWKVALASFVGFALSNTLGFGIVSGATARSRFYARWQFTAAELSRVVLFYSGTFWLGLMAVGGASLIASPPGSLTERLPAAMVQGFGALLLSCAASYIVFCGVRRKPVRIRNTDLAVPSIAMAGLQVCISTVDWLLAAGVLYVLLPAPRPSYLAVAGAFTAAQLIGLASHVPGGVGVFEGLSIVLLSPLVDAAALLQALLLFRVLYYLLPLAVALVVLLVDEALQRRGLIATWRDAFGTATRTVLPRGLAAFTFLAGAVLLVSGATPSNPARMAWLARLMPLPLVEVSHFAASLAGLLLLCLAQAVASRVDAGLYLSCAALAIGIVASLLKGGDYEEALILSAVLTALWSARRDFTRRARLFERPLSPGWSAAMVIVVIASTWLGFFAHRNVQYSSDLWWQFAFDADAPRFLRASVAVTIGALAMAVRSLLRPALPRPIRAGDGANADIDRVLAHHPMTMANLVFLGDKDILWNEERSAFVMYGTYGRTWVALGDPVGPEEHAKPLIRTFLERAHARGAIPAFYEVSPPRLVDYTEYGLSVVKIGEEARVRLSTFTLAGSQYKDLRSTCRRMDRERATFRIVPTAEVPLMLGRLREVSDEWLSTKQVSEKGFSLGFFHADYVARFPIAVIERDGCVEAFANLWCSPTKREVAPDLMRHREAAPGWVMDALFAHLLLWSREQGYEWFNLGMAPLAGLQASPVGRAWSRLGRFVYRHAEGQYNFQGVRAYKDKFDPTWESRYLVYPGGLTLPRVLADVTALVAGGYRQIFMRAGRQAA